jgi:hypothetical protein
VISPTINIFIGDTTKKEAPVVKEPYIKPSPVPDTMIPPPRVAVDTCRLPDAEWHQKINLSYCGHRDWGFWHWVHKVDSERVHCYVRVNYNDTDLHVRALPIIGTLLSTAVFTGLGIYGHEHHWLCEPSKPYVPPVVVTPPPIDSTIVKDTGDTNHHPTSGNKQSSKSDVLSLQQQRGHPSDLLLLQRHRITAPVKSNLSLVKVAPQPKLSAFERLTNPLRSAPPTEFGLMTDLKFKNVKFFCNVFKYKVLSLKL